MNDRDPFRPQPRMQREPPRAAEKQGPLPQFVTIGLAALGVGLLVILALMFLGG